MPNLIQVDPLTLYDFETHSFSGPFTVVQLARKMDGVLRFGGGTTRRPLWKHACLVANILLDPLFDGEQLAKADSPLHATILFGFLGLHHDDHEVVTGDVPTPVQRSLSGLARAEFRAVQDKAQAAIEARIGFPRAQIYTKLAQVLGTGVEHAAENGVIDAVYTAIQRADQIALYVEFELEFGRPYPGLTFAGSAETEHLLAVGRRALWYSPATWEGFVAQHYRLLNAVQDAGVGAPAVRTRPAG